MTLPRMFKKKPVSIEAARLTLDDYDAIANWAGPNCYPGYQNGKKNLMIHAIGGDVAAQLGDWVIKGIKGEFYPCTNEIFWELHDSDLEQGEY